MEIIDLYDNKKQNLNKTMERYSGEPKEGEYKLTVHIWIMNSKGEFLIGKRNEKLRRNPGKWAPTAGAVDAGETSLIGAIREVREELGIAVNDNEIEYLLSFKREKGFVDVWLIKKDIELEELVLLKEEVIDAKWVTLAEIKKMLENGEMVVSIYLYLDLFEKLIKKCHNINL